MFCLDFQVLEKCSLFSNTDSDFIIYDWFILSIICLHCFQWAAIPAQTCLFIPLLTLFVKLAHYVVGFKFFVLIPVYLVVVFLYRCFKVTVLFLILFSWSRHKSYEFIIQANPKNRKWFDGNLRIRFFFLCFFLFWVFFGGGGENVNLNCNFWNQFLYQLYLLFFVYKLVLSRFSYN